MQKFVFFLIVFCVMSNEINAQNQPIYNFKIDSVAGTTKIDFSQFQGKKILIVNCASADTGFSRNYKELIQLYQIYRDKLVVLAIPTNSFGSESGTPQEIALKYIQYNTYKFPVTTRLNVNGSQIHNLYRWLTSQSNNGIANSAVSAPFYKYLISKDGKLIASFNGKVSPMSLIIQNTIQREDY